MLLKAQPCSRNHPRPKSLDSTETNADWKSTISSHHNILNSIMHLSCLLVVHIPKILHACKHKFGKSRCLKKGSSLAPATLMLSDDISVLRYSRQNGSSLHDSNPAVARLRPQSCQGRHCLRFYFKLPLAASAWKVSSRESSAPSSFHVVAASTKSGWVKIIVTNLSMQSENAAEKPARHRPASHHHHLHPSGSNCHMLCSTGSVHAMILVVIAASNKNPGPLCLNLCLNFFHAYI